ncbi:hypothetical protein PR048_005989 [Dryococelus australis]|uniref:Uncharacterized protein n=1 Tax=Dryococelus australis TaxID=614101 RepID=A0ABQ9I9R5_9NEOP|nr:hypothetical protein PR048_005989 [Dryococelus australis]
MSTSHTHAVWLAGRPRYVITLFSVMRVLEVFSYSHTQLLHVHCRKEENVNARCRQKWFQRKNHYTRVNLLTELRCYPKYWTDYLRMDEPTYLELLSMVTPFVKKKKIPV